MLRLFRVPVVALLCVTMLVGLAPAPAQAQARDFAQVDQKIAQLMEMYDVPGASLALVEKGKVIYAKGYGLRNTQTKDPVTENTLFAIGSVTKSFTALGVAQLVQAGKLDLDTPIIKYLPDFKLSDAEATQKLTLRHVLSHTSGLPRADEWYLDKPQTRKQIVEGMAKINLQARVGEAWQYNNQNFVLAGYVLEQIAGQSWEDYTRQNIFAPLGMKAANFDVTEVQKAADYAAPHALDILKGMQPIPFYPALGAIGPAGAINASAVDMGKYAAFQLGDGTADGKQIVSQSLLNEMHKRQIAIQQPSLNASPATPDPANKPIVTEPAYGLGWVIEKFEGVEVVEHDGNVDGFSAEIALVPSAGVGIAILTNADKSLFPTVANFWLTEWMLGLKPERDIVAAFNKLAGYDPARRKALLDSARQFKADPASFQPLLGEYNSPVGPITIQLRDDKLYMLVPSQKIDLELVPFEKNSFMVNTIPYKGTVMAFRIDDQGTVTVYQSGIKLGERLGKDVKAVEVRDPQGKFTANVPPGLVAQTVSTFVIIQSTKPAGIFALSSTKAEGTDPKANFDRFNKALNPTFNMEPEDARDVAVPGGLTWRQFTYNLPSEQVSLNLVVIQDGTMYYVGLVGKRADLEALAPILNSLLTSFKIVAR